jgi:phage gp16-like protein
MTTTSKKRRVVSPRNTELGWIHQAKSKLQMQEDDYRQMLWTQARVHSSKDLDAGGRKRVLAYFASLNNRPAAPQRVKKPLSSMEKKVWAMWYELEAQGKVSKPASTHARAAALRTFVKRQTGVDALSFCNSAQLINLVESMKEWIARKVSDPGAPS